MPLEFAHLLCDVHRFRWSLAPHTGVILLIFSPLNSSNFTASGTRHKTSFLSAWILCNRRFRKNRPWCWWDRKKDIYPRTPTEGSVVKVSSYSDLGTLPYFLKPELMAFWWWIPLLHHHLGWKPDQQVGRYKKAVEEALLVKSDPFVSNLQCPKKIPAHRNWEW